LYRSDLRADVNADNLCAICRHIDGNGPANPTGRSCYNGNPILQQEIAKRLSRPWLSWY